MARDAAGFDEFYRATSGRLLRYAYAVTGDLNEAQDALQEAYTRAWRDWGRVELHRSPEAWVRVVVARIVVDRHRRAARRRKAIARSAPPQAVAPPGEDTVLLTAALRRLPANHRQALALHYLFGATVAEIAQEVGVAEGTVKSWLARGRVALAEVLTDSRAGARARLLGVNDGD